MTEHNINWRPISTAPIGEKILITNGITVIPVASWNNDLHFSWDEKTFHKNGATHWMSMPKPPKLNKVVGDEHLNVCRSAHEKDYWHVNGAQEAFFWHRWVKLAKAILEADDKGLV